MEVDLIHAHDARTHTIAAMWGRKSLIVSRRVAFPIGKSLLSRWKYSRPRSYLAVSHYVQQLLVEAGVAFTRVVVVPDGVAIPAQISAGDRVVALATDDPGKGADLARRTGELAGTSVHFSRDLLADLPHARVFVYFSQQEGLGSAALLALAHGVPVLASRVGGLPEIVVDNETGLLTENDAAQAAVKLKGLLDNPEWAASLGARGREMVRERYTLEHMISATEAAYGELLACS